MSNTATPTAASGAPEPEANTSSSVRAEIAQPQSMSPDTNRPKVDGQAQPHSEESHTYPSGLRYWLAVFALCLAIFLTTLDSTIIATATPYITDQFGSLDDVGWYASIYSLAIAMSQLSYGKLCSRYSIRWIYTIAMFLFLVGSTICATAPTSGALIAGRAISGLGSSGLLIGAFTLVAYLAPPAKRPTFFSLISASRGVAVTCGPLIGGALTERASWRWNFYINLPLGAFIYAVFLYAVQSPKKDTEGFTSWADFLTTLDPTGLVALLASVVCFFLALQWGGTLYAWNSGRIIALIIVSGVMMVVFIGIEYRLGEKAMLPAHVFTQRSVLSASFYAVCNAGAVFTITYYFPIWLQAVKQKTPLASGVATLPWVITSTLGALAGGILISKLGHVWIFMLVGSLFCCVGSGLFTTFEPNTSEGKWIGYQILYAVGSSLTSFTPLVVAQQSLKLVDVSVGSGMLIFSQTIGSALFVAVGQAIFANDLGAGVQNLGIAGLDATTVTSGGISTLTDGLTASVRQAMVKAINDALTSTWLLCVVLSCASVLGALTVEHHKKEQDTVAAQNTFEMEEHAPQENKHAQDDAMKEQ